MRRVKENRQWADIVKARRSRPPSVVDLGGSLSIDIAVPCTVVGGRNGAGKSRLLRSLEAVLGDGSLLLDVHHLCEQALIVLRSREDFGEMADEFGTIGPDGERLEDVQRVVGRDYETLEWYALEIDPADEAVAERFRWSGDQALIPYFRASYRGREFSSRDMGLGEFSVQFLFWILEQYRERRGLVLLLDEPDAFLPPVGVNAFLSRLLRLCLQRDWSLIVSTHSEELIRQALEHHAFLLLQPGDDGEMMATHSADDPRAPETLLARSPIRLVIFCEDETATHLIRSLLDRIDRPLSRSTTICWRNGHGYLRELQKSIPRVPRPDILFGYVFDGDQRATLPESGDGEWTAIALPTDDDPDALFKGLTAAPARLAERLAVSVDELSRRLDSLEGSDPHDWVNGLGDEFGRQRVLHALAELWCDEHPESVWQFGEELAKLSLQ